MQQRGLMGVPSCTDVRREGLQIRLLHRAACDEEADVGLSVGGRKSRQRDRELNDLLQVALGKDVAASSTVQTD